MSAEHEISSSTGNGQRGSLAARELFHCGRVAAGVVLKCDRRNALSEKVCMRQYLDIK